MFVHKRQNAHSGEEVSQYKTQGNQGRQETQSQNLGERVNSTPSVNASTGEVKASSGGLQVQNIQEWQRPCTVVAFLKGERHPAGEDA